MYQPRSSPDLQGEFEDTLSKVGKLTPPVEVACGPAMNQRIHGLPSTVEAESAINLIEQQGYVIFGQ